MTSWHNRLAELAWFFTHIDDVRSDMSVFHRVDDIEQIPVARLVPLMVRLPLYGGAVRFAAQHGDTELPRRAKPEPQVSEPASALSADQLQAMNGSALYGPIQGQQVGMFEVVKVPA